MGSLGSGVTPIWVETECVVPSKVKKINKINPLIDLCFDVSKTLNYKP